MMFGRLKNSAAMPLALVAGAFAQGFKKVSGYVPAPTIRGEVDGSGRARRRYSGRGERKWAARVAHVENVKRQSMVEFWATFGGKVTRRSCTIMIARAKRLTMGRSMADTADRLYEADENRPVHPSAFAWCL